MCRRVIVIMEKALKQYSLWEKEFLPQDLRDELIQIKEENEEIYDRFCRDLSFGTSGLRGKMGAGTNRMNQVVIRRATMGIADYLLERHRRPAMAVSYDTRRNSRRYAVMVAETLSERGIDAWITESPQPVPLLSFAIREMGLDGGIMITASHNPKEFNGYKVYDHCGNQIDDEKARLIESYIDRHEYFPARPAEEAEQDGSEPGEGEIRPVPDRVIQSYRDHICSLGLWWTDERERRQRAMERLSVIYTPLDGTGFPHVMEVFRKLGLKKVTIVESQTTFNGEFSTCPSPNPENRQVFEEAMALPECEEADLIIATDPDSDRMGVMVREEGGGPFVQLSGNQVGVLLFDYLCRCLGREGLRGKRAYKSLVSTPMLDRIAAAYGVKVENTLTGFKNIAARIETLHQEGREDEFLFGFEESLGYLYGLYTRDKDGVMASQLICLAAAAWKEKGLTLAERLKQLYQQYGYMESRSDALVFTQEKDRGQIQSMMGGLLAGNLKTVLDLPVKSDVSFAAEQVYQGQIREGSGRQHAFILRPSGTELKLKLYVFAEGASRQEACRTADRILAELKDFLYDFLKNNDELRNNDGVKEYE